MDVGIISLGTAVPAYKRSQMDTAELAAHCLRLSPAEKKLLKAIYRASGIASRHSILSDYSKDIHALEFFTGLPEEPFPSTHRRMEQYQTHALPLALQAIADLHAENLQQVTHLITVSCTGLYAPGLDIEIVQHLQLNSNTKRTAVNFMGCYGAFNALKLAHSICTAEEKAQVLIVCVELCTLHFQNSKKTEHLISNAIFADGAAAFLVVANPRVPLYLRVENFYCDLVPQTQMQMAWHITDQGFDIHLDSYVADAVATGIEAFAQTLLSQKHLSLTDIDYFAIHPGGMKILKACEKALNIEKSKNIFAYNVLKQYGNMSSATIGFVLKAILSQLTKSEHAKRIFSCAFGPGLTLESMLLSIHHV